MRIKLFLLLIAASLVLSGCAAPAGVGTTHPSVSDQAATIVAGTMQAISTHTTVPTPDPTAEQTCPEPTEGTQLLRNEDSGYCMLAPDGYTPVNPLTPDVCLVPGDPGMMACHSASAFIEVDDAAGRSVSQAADEIVASGASYGEPSSLAIAGVEGVLLPDVRGQGSGRVVLFVHDDRLYTLSFGLPDSADPASVETFDRLYNTVIDSFTLLPVAPPPTPPAPATRETGSALIAYLKGGNVLVWEEATGQTRTIVEFGDVVNLDLSHDGRWLAFVRVSPGGEGEALKSSLWIAEIGGAGAVELAQDGEVRESIGAPPSDNVGFHCVEWIPNDHRLVSVGGGGHPRDQGKCVESRGGALFLFDADTGERMAPLGPPEFVSGILPSPDGAHVAVVASDGIRLERLFLLDVDASLSAGVASLRLAAGPPGVLRGWSQDSSAAFVRGLEEPGGGFDIWRVPTDGSAAESLISLRGGEDSLAPDGTQMMFQGRGQPFAPTGWFFVPFPVEQGAIAAVPVPEYMGFSWSPGGPLYRHDPEALVPLCPGASQVVEACEPSIAFGEVVESVEWIDARRFVYVTSLPRRLMLGDLDGGSTVIAEDPEDPSRYAYISSTCRDDSEFVADVVVADGAHVAPNEALQKTWRIRNTGDCAWDDSYRLMFLSGDRLSGPRSAPLGKTVEPGQEVDVSVMLLTPPEAGTYQGYWQMFARDGTPFGTSMYVAIVVR